MKDKRRKGGPPARLDLFTSGGAKQQRSNRMNNSSFASSGNKVYRFNRLYCWYHFIVGVVFLVVAVLVAVLTHNGLLIFSILIAVFSVFMIARPLTSAVIVDQYSVTSKGMFSESSLPRSSITAIERIATGKGILLILRGNVEKKEELAIPVNLFSFDEDWDNWLSTYTDLSSDKPLSLFPPPQR